MATFEERPNCRRSTSNPPTWETEYVCEGVLDSAVVKASAVNLTPNTVLVEEGFLFRNQIQLREVGYALYYVTVIYGKEKDENGDYTFRFQTTGGTLHITHSRETVAVFQPDGGTVTTDQHDQAIAVDKDNKPQGTDIVVPACKLSYAFKHPAGVVNEAMAINLARLTGCVNEEPWHTFEAGEALFLGAEGSDGTDTDAEVTYHVVAEENLQDLIIAGIEGIEKQGHDFLWVWFADEVKNGQQGNKAKAVFIERLYRRINFAATLGF
jgi:hypothetical protein